MGRKRDLVEKYSLIINLFVTMSQALPSGFYLRFFKLIRHHDNYLAMFMRYICLRNCAKSCGENVAIFSSVYLKNIHNLEIGNNVSIHPMCYIDASGGIQIGNDVSIAHNSTIMSEEHIYTELKKNIKDQGIEYRKTIIEDNVWVGAGSRILGGSMVRSGSIVAAGAVVKNEIKNNSIVGGIPAKIIKERKSQ
jgi:acetyltransferase-like isoleucine patch superfamily enzyme